MFPALIPLLFGTLDPAVPAQPPPGPLPAPACAPPELTALPALQAPSWLPSFFHWTLFEIALWKYAALLLLLLLGLVLRKGVYFVMSRQLSPFAARFGAEWVQRFSQALASPLALLALSGVLALTEPSLRLPTPVHDFLGFAIHLLIVLPCIWALYRVAMLFCDRLETRPHDAPLDQRLDKDIVPIIRGTLQVVITIIGVMFFLQNIGVDIHSLLAGLGLGGIALALASKDLLANFFGSLVLVHDRPFKVGDKIAVNGVEGEVETIGLRSTRLRTLNDTLVTVPNSRLADSTIDSYGTRLFRRTSTTIGLAYDTPPERVEAFVEGIRTILRGNELIREDFEVHFTGFGQSSLEFLLNFYVRNISWTVELSEKQKIYLAVLRLAQAIDVRLALPTQRLRVESVDGRDERELASALELRPSADKAAS
ncbi:MAG: mechanosensitive ion channel family protein [Myxococcales bacterium]|nr:mechanosensitive ion channel family protein [Myxococcales bacterium]